MAASEGGHDGREVGARAIMNAETKKTEQELRSYGRRRGRKPSERQARLLRDVLPRVAFDPARQGQGSAETWLEIGFGGGEHLLWQAKNHPDVMFIGCEPYEDGVIKVLDAVESERLTNVQVHMGDARDVLRALAPATVNRAFILFPDPWPKRKHRKRRLISRPLLDLLASVMRPGAELRFATDIGDYARSALEAFSQEPRFSWTAESPADWRQRPADWPETRYEAKAAAAGRKRYYFRFLRVEADARALRNVQNSPI
jgi:tRNA (guanine-N7-)-methyltransferase